jgi:hypothetical protein
MRSAYDQLLLHVTTYEFMKGCYTSREVVSGGFNSAEEQSTTEVIEHGPFHLNDDSHYPPGDMKVWEPSAVNTSLFGN